MPLPNVGTYDSDGNLYVIHESDLDFREQDGELTISDDQPPKADGQQRISDTNNNQQHPHCSYCQSKPKQPSIIYRIEGVKHSIAWKRKMLELFKGD